jgi:hypothetical protein
MDLGMISTIGKEQTMVKGWRQREPNLVGRSNKGFDKKGAEHPRHMQTFKGTKLGLTGQAKA